MKRQLILVLFFASLLSISFVSAAIDDPVVHYKFDSQVGDWHIQNFGTTGVALNGIPKDNFEILKLSDSEGFASFDQDYFVRIDSHPQIAMGTGDLAISFWVQGPLATNTKLLAQGDVNSNEEGYGIWTDGAGGLGLKVGNGLISQGFSVALPDTQNWHHVVFVVSRSGQSKAYIDGAEAVSAQAIFSQEDITPVDSSLHLGANKNYVGVGGCFFILEYTGTGSRCSTPEYGGNYAEFINRVKTTLNEGVYQFRCTSAFSQCIGVPYRVPWSDLIKNQITEAYYDKIMRGTEKFQGNIDDFMIFKHSLSAGEVAQIYNSQRAASPLRESLGSGVSAAGQIVLDRPGKYYVKTTRVSDIAIQTWGAGGGGGTSSSSYVYAASGGGGGQYVEAQHLAMNPTILKVKVGRGGKSGGIGYNGADLGKNGENTVVQGAANFRVVAEGGYGGGYGLRPGEASWSNGGSQDVVQGFTKINSYNGGRGGLQGREHGEAYYFFRPGGGGGGAGSGQEGIAGQDSYPLRPRDRANSDCMDGGSAVTGSGKGGDGSCMAQSYTANYGGGDWLYSQYIYSQNGQTPAGGGGGVWSQVITEGETGQGGNGKVIITLSNVQDVPVETDTEQPTICGNPNQVIMRLSAESNAHVSPATDNSAPISICYDEIFGEQYTGENPYQCSGSNVVLRASAPSNAHAESPTRRATVGYTDICYGDLSCQLRNAQTCEEGERLVASFASITNSHVSKLDDYPLKLCCTSSGSVGITVEWLNPDNSPIVSNQENPVIMFGRDVKIRVTAPDLANEQATIQIKEKDDNTEIDDDNIKTDIGTLRLDAQGRAEYIWRATSEELARGWAPGDEDIENSVLRLYVVATSSGNTDTSDYLYARESLRTGWQCDISGGRQRAWRVDEAGNRIETDTRQELSQNQDMAAEACRYSENLPEGQFCCPQDERCGNQGCFYDVTIEEVDQCEDLTIEQCESNTFEDQTLRDLALHRDVLWGQNGCVDIPNACSWKSCRCKVDQARTSCEFEVTSHNTCTGTECTSYICSESSDYENVQCDPQSNTKTITITPTGFIEGTCQNTPNAEEAGCVERTLNVPCGRPAFEVPFFGVWQFLGAAICITILYILMFKIKKVKNILAKRS